MTSRKVKFRIRKAHRYLGLFLGIQFLFWTISGLYFSWTDIHQIHGDHYKNLDYQPKAFSNLLSPSELDVKDQVHSIELRDIKDTPYYWINKTQFNQAQNEPSKE